ncbi:hypothetical protein [Photobacterium damselae]|uniref:hypothetical protein n=1 Tax=Photobacterium damselae TaxID=38293 RepID=UPI001F1DD1A4|nr:hypothetical protein [Photobacterium damselae]UKA04687.1 hypothetical protein IHC89_24005 [Photobacterium damselae subsp. damselae]
MKITSTIALAAIAATCTVTSVNAQTTDKKDQSVIDGVHHQFKETCVKLAVTQNLHDITDGMTVNGMDLHKVYAQSINNRGGNQAGGKHYISGEQASWCHNNHSNHSKHHHWKSW